LSLFNWFVYVIFLQSYSALGLKSIDELEQEISNQKLAALNSLFLFNILLQVHFF